MNNSIQITRPRKGGGSLTVKKDQKNTLLLQPLVPRNIVFGKEQQQLLKSSTINSKFNIKKKNYTEGRKKSNQKQKVLMPTVQIRNKNINSKLPKQAYSLELKQKSNIPSKIQRNRMNTDKWDKNMDQSYQNNLIRKNHLKTYYYNKLNKPGSTSPNKQTTPLSLEQNQTVFQPIQSQLFIKNFKNRFTSFEIEELKNIDLVYYFSKRKIQYKPNFNNFDDEEGDLKVYAHDQIIYRYEVISILGKGSFGQVFKALDHKKKQYVALKIIKNKIKYTTQAEIQIMLLRFIQKNDPKEKANIIHIKQSFMFRQHMCITFELLSDNLYQFLKNNNFNGFSTELIRRFAIQILQALLFFEKHHIIHCDLKPQNILLKQENKSGIKIIDLGSSCFQNEIIYTYIQSRFYRAPEIILGIQYTTAIDMWSFGCMLVEFYTGFPIFPGESEKEQIPLFVEILGMPNSKLLQKGNRRKKFFDENFNLRNFQNSKGIIHKPNSKSIENLINPKQKDFIDLIKKCIQWDPQKRIKASQALLHPWIIDALPQQIKRQHIQQMKIQAPHVFV